MKIKTPLDRLAVDKYFQEVIKPAALKETIKDVAIFLLFVLFLEIISRLLTFN
jgi:hypothetical protein